MPILFKRLALSIIFGCALLVMTGVAAAEVCNTPVDISAADKAAIEAAANHWNQQLISGDITGMRAEAAPAIADSFDNVVGNAATKMKDKVAGGSSATTFTYKLVQDQAQTVDAQFYCGIVNDANSVHVSFAIPQLPPGTYGLAITEIQGKVPYRVSYVLQQINGQWKIAGFYPTPLAIAGHDGVWYWKQARDFKAKNEMHNAWFYLLIAQDLLQPVPFISTTNLDKLFSEEQQVQPKDVPQDKEHPVTFTGSNGKTYNLLTMFPVPDDKGNLALVVRYSVPDVSNTGAAFQDNSNLINSLVQKYPEYRQAFNSVVARATAPSGQDFGTELQMKDIK